MALPSVSLGSPFGSVQKKSIGPTNLFGNPSTFTAAANTQASDYDSIMKQYDDLAKTSESNPIPTNNVNYSPIAPQTTPYAQSGDVTSSLGSLKGLTDTGGYSDSDIANIRERDISPIRSIYASGQQQLKQQRRLSGGYSPNFDAVIGQLSRDEAQKISDTTVAANAGIAQNQAANKIASSGTYASAAATANAAKTAADQRNTEIINQINQKNADNKLQSDEFNNNNSTNVAALNRGNILDTIKGKASLYGTTPALTNTFGNQVVQSAQLGQGQQDLNNRRLVTAGSIR